MKKIASLLIIMAVILSVSISTAATKKNAAHSMTTIWDRTSIVELVGYFNLAITGTFTGTIVLLKRYKDWNGANDSTISHAGLDDNATMINPDFDEFINDELITKWITNDTDGSIGPITDNTAAGVVTATLAGGTDDNWDTGDIGSIWEPVATYTTVQYLTSMFEPEQGVDYMAVLKIAGSGTSCVLLRQ